jgi:hypothetical protein
LKVARSAGVSLGCRRGLITDLAAKAGSRLLVDRPFNAAEPGIDRWLRFEEACSVEATIWDSPVFGLAKELKMKKE